jgi:hypothetical protein
MIYIARCAGKAFSTPGISTLVATLGMRNMSASKTHGFGKDARGLGARESGPARRRVQRKFSTRNMSLLTLSSWSYRMDRPSGETAKAGSPDQGDFSSVVTRVICRVARL